MMASGCRSRSRCHRRCRSSRSSSLARRCSGAARATALINLPCPRQFAPAGPGIGVPPPAPDASHLSHTHRRIALLVRPTPPIPRLQAAPPPAISRPERGGPRLLELGGDPPARPGPRHGGKPTWPSSPSSSTLRATGRRHRWSCSRCRMRCPPPSTAHPPATPSLPQCLVLRLRPGGGGTGLPRSRRRLPTEARKLMQHLRVVCRGIRFLN